MIDKIETNGNGNGNGLATPLLHDVRGCAAKLSMSTVSVRKLIRQGRLKRLADFRKILVSDSELRRFATE